MCRSKMRFIIIPIAGLAFLFLVSYLVMLLWNHTLPDILGTQTITYWQAMALFFLCKILFGFGGGGPRRGGPPWKKRAFGRKFEDLSEADKEAMQSYMRDRRYNWGRADWTSGKTETTENP